VRASGRRLRGVVHAAGVLSDGPLLELTACSLASVMDPKIGGAWHLEALTAEDRPDWMVSFSSAAAILGSPGQGGYCAANAGLDALASYARGRGTNAISINWGPWARAGMAATDPDRQARPGSARSFAALEPDDALAILETLLASGQGQTVVMPLDLRDLLRFHPAPGLPFFAELRSPDTAALDHGGLATGATRPDLETAYVSPRTQIEERIASIWQRSLGIDRVGVLDPFFDLGGDSVFANQILLEVNRALGVSIDVTRAFEDFTVATLAALAEEAAIELLAGMSDEEAMRLAGEAT
jgi:acyl carrier protein